MASGEAASPVPRRRVGFGALPRLACVPAALFLFGLALALLLGSFSLFDRALPAPEMVEGRLLGLDGVLRSSWGMFAAGLLVTSVTLSVSLSVTILVPLALAGLVRREETVPYIMGANSTTFVDTLFASLLLSEPRAFTIALTEMGSVAAVSLAVLLTVYRPYRRLVLAAAGRICHSRHALGGFLAGIVLVPVLLLAV